MVHFDLTLAEEFKGSQTQLERMLKLRTTVSLNNMMLFDADGKINKYDSPLEIITDFCRVRLAMYEKRKAYLLAKLQRQAEILSEKARFIKLVLQGEIKVKRRKIFDLVQDLKKHNFKALKEWKGDEDKEAGDDEENKEEDDDEEESEQEVDEEKKKKRETKKGVLDYEYLVGMPIVTLTMEKVQELNAQKDLKLQERDALKAKKPKTIWLEDLDVLEDALKERMQARAREEKEERSKIEKAQAKAGYKDARRAQKEEKEAQREAKRASSTSSFTRLKKQKTSA